MYKLCVGRLVERMRERQRKVGLDAKFTTEFMLWQYTIWVSTIGASKTYLVIT